ncbi:MULTISPECIES: relaxase/mobilization nuclease domain-containing protein [Marivita]|uniref:Relaxase/mobilization nuclease domain-containing protein n=1 Tax=Marivita cryptomonadis TaxID=505252 RepID=A0A9Q2P8Z7_9RHOB|nr:MULTISPECIES: relaxase/mobilization nuclease domain-containing protein [Marivita]MCR9167206.1 relaxase/mobilization nuclease domain-containing protein [Paracoccaceae bacterium]MBM2320519.1 relaxase/mobilization nuclease domain-containing protein [Marivita cryptomonadis]MBM2330099.1 relaxase/mobilization nuclease domain-containing protein [Marivita cryptomonadis]MBM2339686.1 relaxase/mobilization nuclease domain-containing protein [Marivita cryptomonadis]MBM2344345.1 relaxase/mobilization nu
MLIKFFRNGKGAGAGPVGYLVADKVLAYDDNRDLIRDADGQPMTVTREPLPEVLRGNPDRTEALIDASRHQWTYRAGVVSFAVEDAPTEDQQAEVMDHFERLAFAGLDPEQYDVLWVRHTHEDRVELHFCTPRLELTSGRSLNIAPPGYEKAFDSLRDVMNQRHGWADPMELERTQEVRDTIETPTRAQGRDELHAWLQDQISVGLIIDRASMVDALVDAGFDLPRVGKAYLTAQDPDTGERWRLKGEIFHEDWQADPAEREAERGTGHDPAGLRRLDGIPAGELQQRFEQNCDHRASYNRDRYPQLSATEQELADDLALADHGDVLGGDRLDDGRELALDDVAGELGDERTGPDADRQGGRDLAGAGPDQDAPEDLHAGRKVSDLHQDRGELDDDTPDSLGTRLARLRRAVGDGLRGLSAGIERVRSTLDDQDAEPDRWYRAMRDAAGAFASRINESIAWIVERGSELRDAGRTAEQELELSEGRRREAETELEAREVEMDRGMTH